MRDIYPGDPFPVNPLQTKWHAEYPKYKCMKAGYGCMFCGDCPFGDSWKCPEEDIPEYNEYLKLRDAWYARHPNWFEDAKRHYGQILLPLTIQKEVKPNVP